MTDTTPTLFPIDRDDVLAGVGILLVSLLSTVTGTGGGELFLPIFILVLQIDIIYSIPLSAVTVLGGCLGRLLFIRFLRKDGLSKISYVTGLLMSFSTTSSFIGVMLGQLVPKPISFGLIIILLGVSLVKTLQLGMKKPPRKESGPESGSGPSSTPPTTDVELGKTPKIAAGVGGNTEHIPLSLGLTTTNLIVSLLTSFGFKLFQPCSKNYYLYFTVQLLVLICWNILAGLWIRDRYRVSYRGGYTTPKGDIHWTWKTITTVAILSYFVGITVTYLGIGGVIFGPILLAQGISPKVMVYTAPIFILVGAIIATCQYAVVDRILYDYAVWAAIISLIGSIIGMTFADRINKKRILILLGLLLLITVVMLGIDAVVNDKYDQFEVGSLCK